MESSGWNAFEHSQGPACLPQAESVVAEVGGQGPDGGAEGSEFLGHRERCGHTSLSTAHQVDREARKTQGHYTSQGKGEEPHSGAEF